MGTSACAPCTVFDDPDVRDRRVNTEENASLIHYPDFTTNFSPNTPRDRDVSDSTAGAYQSATVHKSSVSDRRAMFESNDKAATKSKKPKAPNTKKTLNKPKKKWTVKGIDEKPNTAKKPINAASNVATNIQEDNDEEPSVSLSHKDRLQLYQKDLNNLQQKEQQRIQQHKESRGGYAGVNLSSAQREQAQKLLEQRVQTQKKGDIANGFVLQQDMNTDNVDSEIVLQSDTVDGGNADDDAKGEQKKPKKRTMNELLKDASKEDARNICQGMGLLKKEYDNKEKREIAMLNMNNNNVMARLLDTQKLKLMYLIAYSLVQLDENAEKIERATMCNAGIDDKLMVELMRILIENQERVFLSELWLENNKIGDEGMSALCELIELNLENLSVIKLYDNKKDVSTPVCNRLIEALEKNEKIIKFVFSFRLQQQRDKLDKLLRRNRELRRKSRLNK